MSNKDRKKEIIKLLEQMGNVTVSELSQRFGVTKETIRRDLESLESEGSVFRTHGGAVLQRKDGFDPPIFLRESIHEREKRAITQMAVSLVNEGDIIAVDSGSTCLHLIRQLPHQNITVITYSLAVVNALLHKPKIKVIVIGGIFDPDSMANVGAAAERMVEAYHVDKFFFSCKGFDFFRGISETFESHVQLKKKIASISEQLILLADSSKYQRRSLIQFMELERVHVLVTDDRIPQDAIKEIQSKGIRVLIADT
jgi:DeoR/GlpR family transcriptional regulator of sugar metabolism